MNKLVYTILFLTIGQTIALGCTCGMTTLKELRRSEFKNSKLIFIADVPQNTGKGLTYQVKVIESLKGEVADSVLTGKIMTSCSDFPTEGRWIMYARELKDGTIEIQQCGLSRPFSHPDSGPFIKRYMASNRTKCLKRAQKDLKDEIELLRRRKMSRHTA